MAKTFLDKTGLQKVLTAIKNKIIVLDSIEEVSANTQADRMAGALAVKELNNNLGVKRFVENPTIEGVVKSGLYYEGADSVLKKCSGIPDMRITVYVYSRLDGSSVSWNGTITFDVIDGVMPDMKTFGKWGQNTYVNAQYSWLTDVTILSIELL